MYGHDDVVKHKVGKESPTVQANIHFLTPKPTHCDLVNCADKGEEQHVQLSSVFFIVPKVVETGPDSDHNDQ